MIALREDIKWVPITTFGYLVNTFRKTDIDYHVTYQIGLYDFIHNNPLQHNKLRIISFDALSFDEINNKLVLDLHSVVLRNILVLKTTELTTDNKNKLKEAIKSGELKFVAIVYTVHDSYILHDIITRKAWDDMRKFQEIRRKHSWVVKIKEFFMGLIPVF